MNAKELLLRTEKNIREETQAVIDMLYDDVQKKYDSLAGAIDISVDIHYYFDYDSTEYKSRYKQINKVFTNKYFQEMLENKFGDLFQYLTFKKN